MACEAGGGGVLGLWLEKHLKARTVWTRAEQSLEVENLIGSPCVQLSEELGNSSLDLHRAASALKTCFLLF